MSSQSVADLALAAYRFAKDDGLPPDQIAAAVDRVLAVARGRRIMIGEEPVEVVIVGDHDPEIFHRSK